MAAVVFWTCFCAIGVAGIATAGNVDAAHVFMAVVGAMAVGALLTEGAHHHGARG